MNPFQSVSARRTGMRSLCLSAVLLAPAAAPLLFSPAALAQTGGQAGIQGTVTDLSGAVIPNATVTITNQETKVVTTKTSSGAGLFEAAPLIPGTYTVEVTAQGFQTFRQENLTIDALRLTGLNPKLTIGSTDQTVTVTAAPPALETTNATLGGTIENDVYESLPVPQNGQQRDPTAFATLLPGAQGGARAPIIGGTGNYLAELSVDGLPLTTINQQGDNRTVLNSIPIEAIDQFQVLTSTPPVEYQGAGLLNFTLKSGTAQYHGLAAAFFRNTAFDTWGYTPKFATGRDANGNVTPARKPYENQNEIVGSAGGPIPFLKKKGFFFFSYDRFHGRNGITPGLLTVATNQMRQGDFSQLLAANGGPGYAIYDPTTQAACTANSTTGACRYQFGYGPGGTRGAAGNPVRLGSPNVIPANEISPIAAYMQSFLPGTINNNITNNVLTGVPTGYDNWEYVGKLDFDLTSKQRLSTAFTQGKRLNVPYTVGANPTLPLPYTNGAFADVAIHIHTLEHAWAISDRMTNQFRFGYVNMGGPPVQNVTTRNSAYSATAAGITNLPPGLSSAAFPGAAFSGANAQTTWTANGASAATYTSVSHTFTVKDNFNYVIGQHNLTAGFQWQDLEINASTYDGPSGVVPVTYAVNETANLNNGAYAANSGYSYASFLLGAPQSTSLTIQSFGILGGRYKPFAPYFSDNWKVRPNLTLDLGLRWDYLPTYTEAKDRWSFLNPNLTNAITGNPGEIQFAGDHGAGVSCQCRTPVHNYFGNYGPRVGFAWQVHPTTVFRGGASILYTHGGGTGGRAGAATGGGQLGYSSNPSFQDSTNGPAFYLNNSPYFQQIGLANTRFGGPTYNLPTPLGPVAAAQTLNTGNYLSNGAYVAPGGVTYVDPYLSGRAPTVYSFNFGFQQALSNSLTVTANYAGTIAHFLLTGGSNARGYWANQMNPVYTAALGPLLASDNKTPLLNAPATAANLAIATRAVPGINVPAAIAAAANGAGGSNIRMEQVLVAFPQYASTSGGNVTDIWGQNVGNNSYNSFQLTLAQRPWKGLSYTLNWTFSRNIGDDGTFRSGFDIPAAAVSNGKNWKADRIERGLTTVNTPENLALYGYWDLPFGKNKYFDGNRVASALLGGFQFSEIFRYTSGTPVAVTWACSPTGVAGVNPGNGQCMPDLNPNYNPKSARINGSFGSGISGQNLSAVKYIDSNAFQTPPQLNTSGSGIYQIGGAPRTAPFNLRNPSSYNLDASLKRSFPLVGERTKLTLQADAFNVLNNTVFGNLNASWPSTSFGTVSNVANTSRRWQFSGRVTF
ncbi:carboxypeptidase-like regulatory domain-containing protein [Terriglobus aquaticus]|uniref:Carboxypeptidase regulatory-like domain-containing protein n=1 Tax=Terriglobus aquaticus TaxID=940139 RepID=A0ABW9KNI0_9BACT|nr:carboxypeptidase-like regulatory domain-containing protein [Terriglobus aquaticus]